MTERVIHVPIEGSVKIVITNDDVIARATVPGGDPEGFFNDNLTEEDVLKHFAYNAVVNGETDVTRLDGWADLDWRAVQMYVEIDYMGDPE